MAVMIQNATLNDVALLADIDDLTHDIHEDSYELVFTERKSGNVFTVYGWDLEDCIGQAMTILNKERVIRDLRAQGLSDDEIYRIVDGDSHPVISVEERMDESWTRGYQAGWQDRDDDQQVPLVPIPVQEQPLQVPTFTSSPLVAVAGEPISGQYIAVLYRVADQPSQVH